MSRATDILSRLGFPPEPGDGTTVDLGLVSVQQHLDDAIASLQSAAEGLGRSGRWLAAIDNALASARQARRVVR